MSALVIWGEWDHEKRARALATTYSTTAQPASTKPSKIKNLASLVFWGHGDAQHFCELTPKEFNDYVADWKKLNGTIQTVEMLTCNARHRQYGYPDSYTEQVNKLPSKKNATSSSRRFRSRSQAASRRRRSRS
jgi:hypothetical protein